MRIMIMCLVLKLKCHLVDPFLCFHWNYHSLGNMCLFSSRYFCWKGFMICLFWFQMLFIGRPFSDENIIFFKLKLLVKIVSFVLDCFLSKIPPIGWPFSGHNICFPFLPPLGSNCLLELLTPVWTEQSTL